MCCSGGNRVVSSGYRGVFRELLRVAMEHCRMAAAFFPISRRHYCCRWIFAQHLTNWKSHLAVVQGLFYLCLPNGSWAPSIVAKEVGAWFPMRAMVEGFGAK